MTKMSADKKCTVILFMLFVSISGSEVRNGNGMKFKSVTDDLGLLNSVRVNKCCEKYEVMVDSRCTNVNDTYTGLWSPFFTGEDGSANIQVNNFRIVTGVPDCGSTQQWPIYHFTDSTDKLVLLPTGRLRHYIDHNTEVDNDENTEDPRYFDYGPGQYCMDKILTTENNLTSQYAIVCAPEVPKQWSDVDFLLRKVVNPVCHGIAIAILLSVAVIYFVLPTLRDLVGNIVTTLTICLIVSQAADLVQIFTEFSSHVSFMVADSILYASLQAAFFWLSGMGFYIWKTFKSRNVFLRVTDGRKYCWYSTYAWGCTIIMVGMALFAHFALDTAPRRKVNSTPDDQQSIGWLGIAVFFTPIAFTILADVFFYVTTQQIIHRMNTYGRIHHKLKHCFKMFIQLLIVMFISWLFLLMSWMNYAALLYCHIIVNALLAPCILYICVIQQGHVMFLLKKSCCYNEPVATTSDWGDEMTHINGQY